MLHRLVCARWRCYSSTSCCPSYLSRYPFGWEPHPQLSQLEVEHQGFPNFISPLALYNEVGRTPWSAFLSHPSSFSWPTAYWCEKGWVLCMGLLSSRRDSWATAALSKDTSPFFHLSALLWDSCPINLIPDINALLRWVKSFPFAPEVCFKSPLIIVSCLLAHG